MLDKVRILGLGRILRVAASVNKHGFTLLSLLHASRKANAFIQDDGIRLSYSDMYSQSLDFANHLHEKYGIGPGSRVAIASANSVAFIRSLFAVSGIGTDIFLVNPNQKEAYYRKFLNSKKIDLVIGDAVVGHELADGGIPFFDHQQAISNDKIPVKAITKRKKGSITVLSGGSTGVPKAERRTVSALTVINPLVDIIRKLQLKDVHSVFISVPVFHGYGLAALLLSVFMGKSIRLTPKFDVEKATAIFTAEKSDCWIVVPRMLEKVLADDNQKLEHLKSIISGGDVLLTGTVERLRQVSKAKLYNLYGTSETGVCTIATDNDLKDYPGTIGRLIKGANAKMDHIGQLLVKCAWASDHRNDGYVATGDIVTKNTEGFFFYKGRVDDMMVIGGENVYPVEVEDILRRHPLIKWVKVKPLVVHETTRIHAELVLLPGSEFNESEFEAWMSAQMPGYMIPRSITYLAEEPAAKLMQ